MRYLCKKSEKKCQDLSVKNYKTLMKENKELNKWRDVPCSWFGSLSAVMMSFFTNLIYRLMQYY